MNTILTPRLRLHRMGTEFLEASQQRLTSVAESISGLQIPAEWFDEAVDVIVTRTLRRLPGVSPWKSPRSASSRSTKRS